MDQPAILVEMVDLVLQFQDSCHQLSVLIKIIRIAADRKPADGRLAIGFQEVPASADRPPPMLQDACLGRRIAFHRFCGKIVKAAINPLESHLHLAPVLCLVCAEFGLCKIVHLVIDDPEACGHCSFIGFLVILVLLVNKVIFGPADLLETGRPFRREVILFAVEFPHTAQAGAFTAV